MTEDDARQACKDSGKDPDMMVKTQPPGTPAKPLWEIVRNKREASEDEAE